MVHKCERCGVSEREVRLFDAVYEMHMSHLCERCSIIENVPIIKKPNSSQLSESERNLEVYDRMKVLSGVSRIKREDTFFVEDKLKELEKNPDLELPETKRLKLIDHFHWEVMKNRRRRGLSQKQLGETIGESEIVLSMIEKGRLPENPEPLIRKLEQFFQIKLRRIESSSIKISRPILRDKDGNELRTIPEKELEIPEYKTDSVSGKDSGVECRIEPFDNYKQKMVCDKEQQKPQKMQELPMKDLDLKNSDTSRLTIGQLKELHRKKVIASRQEQIEEQKKIEERKRILEALRERDRLKIEERKKQHELEKMKLRQENQKIIEQKKEEQEHKKKHQSEEIDRYLGGSELLKKDYLHKNTESSEDKDSDNFFDLDDEPI